MGYLCSWNDSPTRPETPFSLQWHPPHCAGSRLILVALLSERVGISVLPFLQSHFLCELFPAPSRPPRTLPPINQNLRTFNRGPWIVRLGLGHPWKWCENGGLGACVPISGSACIRVPEGLRAEPQKRL